jgi:YggT family protein
LFARVVLSWIRLPYNQVIHFIYQITEPILRPVRNRMPVTWRIDFSPMIIFLILMVIRIVVVGGISDYVAIYRMKYLTGV